MWPPKSYTAEVGIKIQLVKMIKKTILLYFVQGFEMQLGVNFLGMVLFKMETLDKHDRQKFISSSRSFLFNTSIIR